MLWLRRQQGQSARQRNEQRLDTLQAWPSQLVPAMSPEHRRAYELLREAAPGGLVLVHTPLAQFMRVSTRNSYAEWYRRAGRLRASFLLCDGHSNAIAAVDLRLSRESQREQARHARVVRVLESLGVEVLVWTENELPSVSQLRQRLAPLMTEQALPEAPDLGPDMSGPTAAMSLESTDFAALDTAPAPFDDDRRTQAARRPRHA
jgi:hypothetical protein